MDLYARKPPIDRHTVAWRQLIIDYRLLFAIAGGIVLLDQVTKQWVRNMLPLGGVMFPDHWFTEYARIVHWKNTGAAFGMFQDGNTFFKILAFIVALLIINYYPEIPRKEPFLRVALAMQLGGAVGNLIDRLTIGWVTDFVSIWSFPVFNVADLSITLGVILILFPLFGELQRDLKKITLELRVQQIRNKATHQAQLQKNLVSLANRKPIARKAVEPTSLGAIEHVFREIPQTSGKILQLDARRIRYRKLARSKRRS